MKKIFNKRKVSSGPIWNAYFAAAKNDAIFADEYEKTTPFSRHTYSVPLSTCFVFNNKIYAVLAYDHFNAHFSNFADPAAIYGLTVAEVREV